jgi:PhoH-like ATPase
MNFENVYVLDTNIILNDASDIFTISQQGSNLIVLPETVIDELDSKKTGFDEINFQARTFGRMLSEAEVIKTFKIGKSKDVTIMRIKIQDETIIDIVSFKNYDLQDVEKVVLNDRKIIKVASFAKNFYKDSKVVLLSMDVMCRTRAISLGVETEPLNFKNDGIETLKFHKELFIYDFDSNSNPNKIENVEHYVSSIEVINDLGKKFHFFKNRNNQFEEIDQKNEKRFPAPPVNLLQKVASNIIYDENDITILIGKAGSGKNLIATSSAMRLIDSKNYKKIYYIRRTIISGDIEDEIGFLPGSLEEKMGGYNYPMENTLVKLAKLKKRDATKEEINEIVDMYKKKYDIEYLYAGHLRGSTLEDDSIIIIDEAQNTNINFIKTMISRVGQHSIVLILGSNNQIDSKYVNKHTNGMTQLVKKSLNNTDISIKTVELKNVIRSKHADWVDTNF